MLKTVHDYFLQNDGRLLFSRCCRCRSMNTPACRAGTRQQVVVASPTENTNTIHHKKPIHPGKTGTSKRAPRAEYEYESFYVRSNIRGSSINSMSLAGLAAACLSALLLGATGVEACSCGERTLCETFEFSAVVMQAIPFSR